MRLATDTIGLWTESMYVAMDDTGYLSAGNFAARTI